MAEYIEREELYRRVKRETNPYGKPTLDYESGVRVLDMIKNAPSADVVPRAEVERLIDDFKRTMRADAKVGMSAGEILMHIGNMLAELKKKYLGEKDDG